MSKILASIKNLSEAKILIDTDIDIIDLKDPSKGALGRLDKYDIDTIVSYINNKKLTSSTIGDLPNDEILISKNIPVTIMYQQIVILIFIIKKKQNIL